MHDIAKDVEVFPGFDEALVADLRTSLELFLDEVIWNQAGDYRQLLLADYWFANGRMAQFYGLALPAEAPFQRVPLDPQQRAGVLSHPLLLSGFAYHASSSPIHRGVFVARSLLGRSLRPPPEAVSPLSPELHADLTTRERVLLQTSPATCQSCHAMINPLGFPLEHFDAVGRYRTEEKGKPVNASGQYLTGSGARAEFAGARELAEFLANTEESQGAFVEQLFHHQIKQPIGAFGGGTRDDLLRGFAESDFDVRKLLVHLTTVAALAPRSP